MTDKEMKCIKSDDLISIRLTIVLVVIIFIILFCTSCTSGGASQPDKFPITSRDISVYCSYCRYEVGGAVIPEYDRGVVYVIFNCDHLESIIFYWNESKREWYPG